MAHDIPVVPPAGLQQGHFGAGEPNGDSGEFDEAHEIGGVCHIWSRRAETASLASNNVRQIEYDRAAFADRDKPLDAKPHCCRIARLSRTDDGAFAPKLLNSR
jgi:hypothetical protein